MFYYDSYAKVVIIAKMEVETFHIYQQSHVYNFRGAAFP